MKHPAAHFKEEEKLWNSGTEFIAGVDEVGRGSWAGPVVAAAVVFPRHVFFPEELYDSKLIMPKHRERLASMILETSLAVGIGIIGVSAINKVGIGKSTQKAFRKAVRSLALSPEKILIDAFYIKGLKKDNQMPIKNGDRISASIAAASIVAKVHRDAIMRKLSRIYPLYGFGMNKGYGTLFHQNAIRKYNFCSAHRKSFDLGYLLQ